MSEPMFQLRCVSGHKESRSPKDCRTQPMCKTCFMPMTLEGVTNYFSEDVTIEKGKSE